MTQPGRAAAPVEAARALRTRILENRDAIEAKRMLVPDVVAPMVDAGLFRLFVPADVGGLEVEPLAAYRAYEELARADASVAWVAWNNSLPALASRGLDHETRAEIFGDPKDVYANSTRPSGRALPSDGGVRLSGRWALVSGCQLASWIPVMAPVMSGDAVARLPSGVPDVRLFFLPKGDYEILDTWNTGGLRGSGSHDVVTQDVFVPDRRSCWPLGESKIDGPLFRFPFAAALAPGCASVCLGVATSALETLVALAANRPQIDPGPALQERPHLHAVVGRAESRIESARLLLHDAVARVWSACETGSPSLSDRAPLWRAVRHAAEISKEVVGMMFEAGGTSAVYAESPLDRCQRDIWVIEQHMILQPTWAEQAGRVRLGLEPTHPMF
jgi:alkylation response protein AidB-like acyl-CoA dehydrogenase